MINKYLQKSAVEMAKAVCSILNHFPMNESTAFRQELLFAIQGIKFDGETWMVSEEIEE